VRDVICAQPFATASSPTSVMSMYFSGKPDFRGEYGVGSEDDHRPKMLSRYLHLRRKPVVIL
jgi:hypothetical protein